jgi:hypothetical protein
VSTSASEETEKLLDISEALAIAVLRSDELDDESANLLSEIKLEKFLYFALKEQDELDEITNSWYLAGAKTETDFGGTDAFKSFYDDISSPEESTEVYGFTDYRYQPEIDADIERYVEFFEQDFDLEEAWFTQGEAYLLEFYEEEAPIEYRDLYVSVQEFRNYLNQIKRSLENIISIQATQNGSLSEYGQENIITGPNNYSDISHSVSKIHLELGKHENLSETVLYMKRFTDLVEDATLALSKMQVERIDDSVIQTFKQMRQRFYYDIWRLPAILISIETARGPRREELAIERAQELEAAKGRVDDVLEKLEQQCAEASLVPTKVDYPASSEDDETIDELMKLYTDDS